ncbi:glycoside hydrolase superfamily [Choanephora cucurbitarum]|nr:glycoside hydrolase superfamily [Choanephora cucurbitarum]
MLAEGFQCWSTTRELDSYSRLAPIPRVVAWATQFDLQGDYNFFDYANRPGQIHSTGYTYFRHQNQSIVFLGSTTEQSGYTYFKADLNKNKLSIYKDIEGKRQAKGQSMQLQIYVAQHDLKGLRSIWQQYATYYHIKDVSVPSMNGWSSWYNYYEQVTEKDVLTSLAAFERHQYPIDVFQIDDGYQAQIGDWLEIQQTKFPQGMAFLANKIKAQGYLAGLWLAPFAVGFKSRIVKEHPDWLLKHPDQSFVVAGPNWGGFYALDIYHPAVERYLQRVFDQVVDWGFGLLKLDFLFAAAMIPREGKTRGEILFDAMDLIVRLNQGRTRLLGSGVTLPSTWGKLDYSRVSSDASPWWDHTVLRLANVRERVATFNALTSTLNRWAMSQTVFGSDPDVFFIRSDKNQLTTDEKYTLVVVNTVTGQLTLMSDNVDLYSPQEHRLYGSLFPKAHTEVQSIQALANQVYQAEWTSNGRQYLFFANLSPLPTTVQLPLSDKGEYDTWFEPTYVLTGTRFDWLRSQASIFLRPHQTRLWMKLSDDVFVGGTGHLIPGSDLQSISVKDNFVQIELKAVKNKKKHKLFLRLKKGQDLPTVEVNGQRITQIERLDWDEHLSVAKITCII